MDELLNSAKFGELITNMSKETVEVILASEKLSTMGTKKELKARLRDFVNDRRDAAARDNTIFDDSVTENVEQIQHDTEQAGGPSFPAAPENIINQSFDTAIQNLSSQGFHAITSVGPPAPVSRSTTFLTTAPLPVPTLTAQTYTNVNPILAQTVTSSPATLYPKLPLQTNPNLSTSTHTNILQTPVTSSTLNAHANQFQPNTVGTPTTSGILNPSNVLKNFSTPNVSCIPTSSATLYANNTQSSTFYTPATSSTFNATANASQNFNQQNWCALPQQNQPQNLQLGQQQNLQPSDINLLFAQFCNFLQTSNLTHNFSQQPSHNQNFPQVQNTSYIPQNPCNTSQNTTQPQIPQNYTQANAVQNLIDPKRMSYISQAIEKRKVFFNGKQGSDPHRFLDYLNECSTSMGITDLEIYNCLPVVLHGEALDWFRINKSKMPTFKDFSQALVSNFSVKNYQDKLMYEALARQQGKNEPITTFVTNIRLIFNQMEPRLPESRQIDIACNNLNPSYI